MNMIPLKTAPVTACLCVVAAQFAAAQVDPARFLRSEFGVAVGIAHTERLDATASPVRFGGQGFDVVTHYRRARGTVLIAASIDFGMRDLVPQAPSEGTGERLTSGDVHVSALRLLGDHAAAASRSGIAVGIDMAATIDVTAHHYADPNASISDFLIGALTLGPAVSWERHVAGGTALVHLTAPIVGFVDHPYSDTRAAEARVNARFVTVREFRGLAGAIVYAPSVRRRVGIEYAYRFRLLGYADLQPVHSASQALSVGVVTRFGPLAPLGPR
jgi:hypothetical protein